tara:strand:- start:1173 stop:1757 length:585 start_codon:yes stop_codon:yes gene_type:complete
MSFVDSKNNKFYKIGISNNFNKRKTSLQKDIDFELKIVHTDYINNTAEVENNLKKKYNNKNVTHYYLGKFKPTKKPLPNHTEWFSLNSKDILQIKLELKKHKIFEEELDVTEEVENIEPKIVNTYLCKRYIKGKLHYKISAKQYFYLKKKLKNKLNYTELKFIEQVCKMFEANKFLTFSQYNFLIKTVYKYNQI